MEERNDSFWSDDISILYNKDRLIEFFPTKDMSRNEKLNALVRFFIYAGVIVALQQGSAMPLYLPVFGMAATYFIHKNVGGIVGTSLDELLGRSGVVGEEGVGGSDGSITSGIKKKKVRFADGINREHTDIDGNPYELVDGELDPILIRQQMDDELGCAMPTENNPFMNFMRAGDDPRRFSIPPCDIEDTLDQPGVKDRVEDLFDQGLYKDVGQDIYERNNSQRQFFSVPMNDQGAFANWLYNSPPTCKEDQLACLEYEDVRAKRPIFPNPQSNPVSTKRFEQLPEEL